jgi:hypothetical protein
VCGRCRRSPAVWHRTYMIARHGSPWSPDRARQEARRVLGEVAKAIRLRLRSPVAIAISMAELCWRYLADVEAGRLLTRRKIAKEESIRPMKAVGGTGGDARLTLACDTVCLAGFDTATLSTEPGTPADRFYRLSGWLETGQSCQGEEGHRDDRDLWDIDRRRYRLTDRLGPMR